MKKYFKELRDIMKKPSTWFFLAIITFAGGMGFSQTVLMGGTSKLAGTVNYILTALIIFIPILTVNNRMEKVNEAGNATAHFFSIFTISALSAFSTLFFAIVISEYGVFKWKLYICNIISVLCISAVSTAVNMFISLKIRKKSAAYAVSYILVIVVIACEILYSYLTPSALTKVLYVFSLTKYCGAFSLGIIDVRTVLLSICLSAALILTGKLNDLNSIRRRSK